MRSTALDVHRDFCEVAIAEAGEVRPVGRARTEPEALELFARSLAATDLVALEATGNGLAIARILEPHVARVLLANPKAVGGDADGEDLQGMHGRWRSCSPAASCPRFGSSTSRRACFVDASRAGRSWSSSARARRIRCTRS